MKSEIYVNRHRVRSNNKKAKEIDGSVNDAMAPCIAIKTYKGVEYAKEACFGDFVIQQDWDNPPCSGAKIWITGPREHITIIE